MIVGVIYGFLEKKLYYSFWQIRVRWAIRGIGFSEKLDFRRVVRFALAGGFVAADLISHFVPPSLPFLYLSLCVSQPPLLQAMANWTCPAHCCCIHSWYETDVRSLTGKPRGWSRLCSLFLPAVLPVGIVRRASEFLLLQHTRDALHPRMYVHVCTQSNATVTFVRWKCSYLQIFLPFLSSIRLLL